jgi:hypothetical protein
MKKEDTKLRTSGSYFYNASYLIMYQRGVFIKAKSGKNPLLWKRRVKEDLQQK